MLDDDLSAYFVAVSSLRSADPSVRRPALSVLLGLARGSKGPIQASAERALAKEFGPYAVSEGLSGCAGPMEAVFACCADDSDCRTCPWMWEDEPLTDFDARAALGRSPEIDTDAVASQHLDIQKA
jgi:hypothetical protein